MTFKDRSGGRAAPSPSGSGGLAVARAWSRLFACLLLACVLVQGTLVQSHLHFAARTSSALAAPSEPSLHGATPASNDPAAACMLCHEAAMAGAYLLPTAIVVPLPPAPILWLVGVPLAGFGLPSPAFGWLSRAPPR